MGSVKANHLDAWTYTYEKRKKLQHAATKGNVLLCDFKAKLRENLLLQN